MPTIENLDFLNENTLRNFPIKEGVSCIDSSGALALPDNFMVDLVVSASSDPTLRVYVSQIVNMPGEIDIELAAYGTGASIGVFNIPTQAHVRYNTYYMTASSGYAAATGKLTIAEVSSMMALPSGVFTFDQDDTELEMRTIVPGLATISRFVFENADGTTISVTGDIIILAQTNTKFRRVNDTTVAIDAGDGLGLNAPCADDRPCLKTINSIAPDSAGNFSLTTSDCAKFSVLSSGTLKGLNLADTCCKPCLSCNEIGDLTQRLMQLESDLLTLRDHYGETSLLSQQFGQLSNASCECT